MGHSRSSGGSYYSSGKEKKLVISKKVGQMYTSWRTEAIAKFREDGDADVGIVWPNNKYEPSLRDLDGMQKSLNREIREFRKEMNNAIQDAYVDVDYAKYKQEQTRLKQMQKTLDRSILRARKKGVMVSKMKYKSILSNNKKGK